MVRAMKRERGFTIIELMVAMVVGALLLSALVSLSGSIQKSFARAKDITELQSNLRFAMKVLKDDFSRVAYMSSPDPGAEECHQHELGTPPDGDTTSLEFDDGDNKWILRGNFISSRDYRICTSDYKVLCRNGLDPVISDEGGTPGVQTSEVPGSNSQYDPFADGPKFGGVFTTGTLLRFDTGDGRYTYHRITGANAGTYTLNLDPPLDRNIPGDDWWASPLTQIEYRYEEDDDYDPIIPHDDPENKRWVLKRVWMGYDPDTGEMVERELEVAEFLLAPPNGLTFQIYEDAAAVINEAMGQPVVDGVPDVVSDADDVNAVQARALVITIRARNEVEDPAFTLDNPAEVGANNHGVDLDGDPDNGLARVRMETTVVELRNLGLNPCIN